MPKPRSKAVWPGAESGDVAIDSVRYCADAVVVRIGGEPGPAGRVVGAEIRVGRGFEEQVVEDAEADLTLPLRLASPEAAIWALIAATISAPDDDLQVVGLRGQGSPC